MAESVFCKEIDPTFSSPLPVPKPPQEVEALMLYDPSLEAMVALLVQVVEPSALVPVTLTL